MGDWEDPRNLHSHSFLLHSAHMSPNLSFLALAEVSEGPGECNAVTTLLDLERAQQT